MASAGRSPTSSVRSSPPRSIACLRSTPSPRRSTTPTRRSRGWRSATTWTRAGSPSPGRARAADSRPRSPCTRESGERSRWRRRSSSTRCSTIGRCSGRISTRAASGSGTTAQIAWAGRRTSATKPGPRKPARSPSRRETKTCTASRPPGSASVRSISSATRTWRTPSGCAPRTCPVRRSSSTASSTASTGSSRTRRRPGAPGSAEANGSVA